MGRRHPENDRRREQAPKQPRGFARGHGAHHRSHPGHGAPHAIGTGRDRTGQGTQRRNLARLSDDDLENLAQTESVGDLDKRIEVLAQAAQFGAELAGDRARGLVLEVRKGNFLTQILERQDDPAAGPGSGGAWRAGDVLRTFVRGTMQQFDLGLVALVAPGDEIEVVVPPHSSREAPFHEEPHAILTRVTPRRNEFRRLHPSGRAIQTIAANIDRVLIVTSAGEPEFRPGFVDRVLVCANSCEIPAALLINKIDLGLPAEDEELLAVYRGLGLPAFKLSLRDPRTPQGDFDALKALLTGARTLLTGHSGVGKSTLLLALDSRLDEAMVRVGEVSTQTHKGTHTTTHGRLFDLRLSDDPAAPAGAQVIDTPGVREFTPADTDRRNLWGWFPEIARLQGQCSFADCSHTVEAGCAVLVAVERGEIHPRRHESYVRIYQTLPV